MKESCKLCPVCGKPVSHAMVEKYPGAVLYHMACAVASVPNVNDDQKGRK